MKRQVGGSDRPPPPPTPPQGCSGKSLPQTRTPGAICRAAGGPRAPRAPRADLAQRWRAGRSASRGPSPLPSGEKALSRLGRKPHSKQAALRVTTLHLRVPWPGQPQRARPPSMGVSHVHPGDTTAGAGLRVRQCWGCPGQSHQQGAPQGCRTSRRADSQPCWADGCGGKQRGGAAEPRRGAR